MDTLIVPGYSLKNKDWAEETKRELAPRIVSSIVYWPHWETGQSEEGWIEKEVEKFLANEESQINIIAKSIGTLVTMKILKSKPQLINKIILCGIFIYDFKPGDEKFFQVLESINADNVLCFQNENDNHGSFADVEKFIHAINPKIKVISRPRSDHEYPYPEDFIKFLCD